MHSRRSSWARRISRRCRRGRRSRGSRRHSVNRRKRGNRGGSSRNRRSKKRRTNAMRKRDSGRNKRPRGNRKLRTRKRKSTTSGRICSLSTRLAINKKKMPSTRIFSLPLSITSLFARSFSSKTSPLNSTWPVRMSSTEYRDSKRVADSKASLMTEENSSTSPTKNTKLSRTT